MSNPGSANWEKSHLSVPADDYSAAVAEIRKSPVRDRILDAVCDLSRMGIDVRDPKNLWPVIGKIHIDWLVEERAKARQVEEPEIVPLPVPRGAAHASVVYYMRLGPLVKIGVSTNIGKRVEALNPQEILAVEVGKVALERRRHREFKADHEYGEWFRASETLMTHIAEVRRRFEAEQGFTTVEWLQDQGVKLDKIAEVTHTA